MIMKNIDYKKFTPYLAALGIFVLISLIYFNPVLEGKVLSQHDVMVSKSMQKEMENYHEETGDYTLWTNSVFSGMPTYQIGGQGVPNYNIYNKLAKLFQLGMPNYSVDLVLMYMLGFFILLLVCGLNPWLSIVGAIAFAFSSYNFIIIEAGHINKAYAIGYMPLVLAGFILTYKRKYILGGLLTMVALGIHIFYNHVQMTYYLMFLILFFIIGRLIHDIKNKQIKGFAIASAIVIVASFLALLPNYSHLKQTLDYSQQTIRGGSELATDDKEKKGLDKDYAMAWSYGRLESFSLIIPNIQGGASSTNLDESSNMYKELVSKGQSKRQAKQLVENAPTYWGDQSFTSGPVYFGAIVCFLFILGMFIVKPKYKWWLFAISVFSIFLALGKNFESFNMFLFENLPLFNKFRAVSSALVIASISFPLLGFLALRQVYTKGLDGKKLKKGLLWATGISGGLVLLILLVSSGFDYSASVDEMYKQSGYPGWLISAIMKDREKMLKADAIRSLVLILLSAIAILLYLNNKVQKMHLILALGILVLIDLWGVDKRYLNNEDFKSKRVIRELEKSPADERILNDPDINYRVFNLTTDPFRDGFTSYYHKSIGGYHGAKLSRYQDLIERHLSRNNMKVLNMLNSKYFIVKGEDNQPLARLNPGALGHAWFIKNINWVDSPLEEIEALNDFDPANTVVIDKKFKSSVGDFQEQRTIDSAASIELVSYEPDKLTYKSSTTEPQLAVFSEIYYQPGWHSYLNGEKVEHFRVNYILRGMVVPKGENEIVFEFAPEHFYKGQRITLTSSISIGILILLLLGFKVYIETRRKKKSGQ